MASEKVETVVAGNYVEMRGKEDDDHEGKSTTSAAKTTLSKIFWNGGSVYDAWFSCASNQVAQVLLTLPYSFSQLGMVSGILFQLFYGLMGSWTAYLISVLYVEYRTRKEREKVDFRNHVIQLIACASNIYYINDNLDKRTWIFEHAVQQQCLSLHSQHRIWSFLGLIMTSYTAWYLTIASLIHGQVEGVKHSGAAGLVLYFTGATNILYTFVAMLSLSSAVYWAFGDLLLNRSNALALLPRTGFRDTAVILMLIHQNAVERAPRIVGGGTGLYVMNIFVVAWVYCCWLWIWRVG
ncbi:UNVERIFIED_CONTAM: Auxin transporter-like protein 3 [Sesamum latifolium]|uniref:Auxin transporter-like protein 3 n=1 Tax=Sesamum latifolium TaxID=2727402 RepID=A0AAW2W965_9LAMI